MKKKIIALILIIIIMGVIGYIIFNRETYSIITLDINPSIEIKIDNDKKVKSVNPLNDDAKKVVSDSFNNKSLDDVLRGIIDKLIENDFIRDNDATILIHSEGVITNKELEEKLKVSLSEKNIVAEIVSIEKVTKEDIEMSKKYGITLSKASYINQVKKDNENLVIEDLINKSVNELRATKEKGLYCDSGYFLEGDHCFKKIGSEAPINGQVCPGGYHEYKGKCYQETSYEEGTKYVCDNGFTLEGDSCINISKTQATGVCDNGQYYSEEDKCATKKYIGDAYEYCRDPGRTLYEHKCLATKPTINGGCLGSDKLLNGKCVNTKNDYYASEWMCPNGKTNSRSDGSLLFPDNKCYEEEKTNPTSYSCPSEFELNGKECIKKSVVSPHKERFCPSGYTKVDNDICINYNKQVNKQTGYVCKRDTARLEGNSCIIYDIVEAKHN